MVTKVKVLNKFLEIFELQLKKHPPFDKTGGTFWDVVDKNGSSVCFETKLPNTYNMGIGSQLYACGPRTHILDTLLSPTTHSLFIMLKEDSRFLNPLAGCKSLEEAWMKLDLISKA